MRNFIQPGNSLAIAVPYATGVSAGQGVLVGALFAACWRPLMMITFGILIVLRWLGWSAPGISEAEALKLWNIVEIGLGGYVIGRSAEKTLPRIVEVLRR